MRGQRAVVGVDLGTSGVKVLVAGLDGPSRPGVGTGLDDMAGSQAVADPAGSGGGVLGRAGAESPVLVPSAGRAESDPADWWRATCRAVRQAVAQAPGAEIVAVAVAGQMHGVVLTAAPPPT